jgi:hypothetical protein
MKVLFLCLLFGLTSCTNAQNSNSSVLDNQQSVIQATNKEPLDVSFCELIKSPEKFEQKLVRVKAVYRYGFEWSEFYSLNCPSKKRVWVEGERTKCANARSVDEMDFAGMGGELSE